MEQNLSNEIKKIIFEELPKILEEHPEVRMILWKKLVDSFADKKETESRFEILLKELKELKEESNRKWKELKEESDRRWEELNKKWRELKEESDRKWEESNRRWRELKEESDKRWETLLKEVHRVDTRIERTIEALGARWGISSEKAFRQAIKRVFEELTNLKVEHYWKYDEEGFVFGKPD